MRKLSSWIQGFLEYTEKTGSPEIWRKWTGIYTVAAAMERKTYVITSKGTLFPNLYIIIVGPAGAGKTIAANSAYEMMTHLDEHHVAPTALSRASLIDALIEAERKVPTRKMDDVLRFNALAVFANELGTLIPAYENDFINVITDIYDGKRYEEKKRTSKLHHKMEAPLLNFLAATTPSYLNNLMPEGAWDQGFISRTKLIYSGEENYVDLFTHVENNSDLHKALVHDLLTIGALEGRFVFEADAIEAIRTWMLAREEPKPTHPKLQFYNKRRSSHLLKLCMIASAATRDDLKITLDVYAEAYDWLLEAEAAMPDIFKAMASGGSMKIVDDTWYWAYEYHLKKREPVPDNLVYKFIMERAPVSDVQRIVDMMLRAGILVEKLTPAGKGFEVRPRR